MRTDDKILPLKFNDWRYLSFPMDSGIFFSLFSSRFKTCQKSFKREKMETERKHKFKQIKTKRA